MRVAGPGRAQGVFPGPYRRKITALRDSAPH